MSPASCPSRSSRSLRRLSALVLPLFVLACSGDSDQTPDLSQSDTLDATVQPDTNDATTLPDAPDTTDTNDTTDDADATQLDTGDTTDPNDSADAPPPPPGTFGAPCEENNNCLSGLCIQSNQGPICTRTCVEECPSGFSCLGVTSEVDVTFLCVPKGDRLCQPCALDTQCGSGYCLSFDEGQRCTAGCDTDEDCPSGFSCDSSRSELSSDRSSFQCVPIHDSCECLPGREGLQRPCNNQNAAGSCWGLETCLGEDGWSTCSAPVPAAEVCDGVDNNCNLFVDENLTNTGATCELSNDFGTCSGLLSCQGTNGVVCVGPTASAEACNYQDDDCDGLTDEDFRALGQTPGLYSTDLHCGVCGNDCTGFFPNAVSGCSTADGQARCVVRDCDPGFYQAGPTTCLPVVPASCLPCTNDLNCVVPGNACVPLDGQSYCAEDCGPDNLNGRPAGTCADGYTCTPRDGRSVCLPDTNSCTCLSSEDADTTRPCTASNTFGTCAGTQTCTLSGSDAGFSTCTARVPAAETCNGLDDDCDGQVDEGVAPPPEACAVTNAAGTCTGDWQCSGTSGWTCSANTPATESCNFADDDCDGQTDEPFIDPVSGQYNTEDHCGLCNRDCDAVILFSAATECRVESNLAVCVATACADGFYIPPDTDRVCIPTSGAADCSPCAEDAQCAELSDGRCSTIDGARVCTRGCTTTANCSEGYDCVNDRCLPTSRSCSCLTQNAGSLRPCVNQNAAGTCTGVETCDPDTTPGWSTCTARTPTAELCNGEDDNCNGRLDENLAHNPTGCSDSNDFGTCIASYRCEGEAGWQCPVREPEGELCNFQDDDCDGLIDEDFKSASNRYVDPEHCGVCNNSCDGVIPNATATCSDASGSARCQVDTCDPGFYQVGPLTCLPAVDVTCTPCVTDQNCPTPGDRCLDLDGGRFCGRDCGPNNFHGVAAGVCNDGFECLDIQGSLQCVPTSGSCTCQEDNDGDIRTCAIENAAGRCTGTELCDPSNPLDGWAGCSARTPAAETCNGVDDDCDGLIDETVIPPTAPCQVTNPAGTCTAAWTCQGAGGWTCNAATPTTETCNAADDDCDGQTDEDMKVGALYATLDHCGACNLTCEDAFPNATAACQVSGNSARCEVAVCDPGFYRANPLACLPATDSTCLACTTDANCPTPGDKCLDLDGGRFCGRDCSATNNHGLPANTCDPGYTCTTVGSGLGASRQCIPISGSCSCLPEDNNSTRPCQSATDDGTCFGSQTCAPATGWTTCSARTPAAESCNGVDDDCNGLVDEGLTHAPLTCDATVAGVGTCVAPYSCSGVGGWTCTPATPAVEVCDFLDNDCDSAIDETFRTGTAYTSPNHCGTCGVSCAGSIPNATATCGLGPTGVPRCEVLTCAPGFYEASPLSCAPVTEAQCAPCNVDGDCRTPGDRCLTLSAGEKVCGRDCSASNLHGEPAGACDPGYECLPFAGGPAQCVPTSGTCSCLPTNDGAPRTCANTTGAGTCFGTETCDVDTGWVGCSARTPTAESCNGVDDDCDGLVDEDLTHAPLTCSSTVNGVGTCSANYTCNGAGGWVCVAQTPVAELCDFLDNDCDAAVDESFKDGSGRYVSDQHCGSCGITCAGAIPNATATCRVANGAPRCEVLTCGPGYYQAGPLTCLPATDNSCAPCVTDANCRTPGDKCLDLDGQRVCGRDCSANNVHTGTANSCGAGFVCTSFGADRQCVPTSGSCTCLTGDAAETRSCAATNGLGTCFGAQTCAPATGWSGCTAATPTLETCNSADDNCNAIVDDVANRGGACQITNANGSCGGSLDCLPGFSALQCVARTPAAERCNYIDDDCDGQTDEGAAFSSLNQSCFAGNGACRRFGFNVCSADGLGTTCNAVAAAPTAELCDGVDNDCDNQVDEEPAWSQKGSPCTLGQGLCQVTGVYQCSANGQSVSCSQTPPAASFPNEAGRCNNLDDDCDGPIDEDFANKGQVCSVGLGVCRSFGNFVCAANGGSTVCDAVAGGSSSESCDLLDNDCDGSTDETFKNGNGQYATATTCGNCFTNCQQIYSRPKGYGVCNTTGAPTCALQCCRAGDGNAACDGGNWYDLNAVPDDGCEFRLDPDAVYVSISGTNAVNTQGCGTGPRNTSLGAYPCRTIAFGLSEAVRLNRSKVLVADGLYEETITLVGGKSILGGHRADTWERNVAATNTTLRGPTVLAGHSRTVIADGITTATVFEGFVVYGGRTFGASSNTYAFWLRNSNANLVIRNNLVFGGDAGDGADGAAGGLGTDGGSGQPGERAVLTTSHNSCGTQSNQPGNVANCFDSGGTLVAGACGAGGANTCGGSSVAGGAGRGAICPSSNTQQATGTAGSTAANGGSAGGGGAGGYDRVSDNCSLFGTGGFNATAAPGTDGGRGVDRSGGTGGTAGAGSVSGSDWVGVGGAAGLAGRHGGGGGGGGAGGGADVTQDCSSGGDQTDDSLGGSGGGGGAGGCGGTGGGLGAGGGGSFVFFVTSTAASANLPAITGNIITRGRGGDGGNGGIGGKGGAGGEGGSGGAIAGRFGFAMGVGGRGGQGGDGGHGGGGGGGGGGASYGVYVHNNTAGPTYHTTNTFVLSGAGGAGGAGGASPGLTGADGSDGVSADRNY